ncbi:MAG: FecR domain-containing protein [Odoribacteraceae bacterium]|jgi:ferric-dicitrate binding protein FerR (iron transport regulator)|nr:FecR domain-containing protein [Odoribacteraceae bacterium]
MDFNSDTIHALIAARLCGETLREEENRRLDAWLELPGNKEEYAYYRSIYQKRGRLRVWDSARPPRGFAGRNFREKSRLSLRARRWSRYAVVIVPLLIVALAVSLEWGGGASDGGVDPRDVAPGSSRAVLQREDGRQFVLADSGLLLVDGIPSRGQAAGTLEYRDAGELPAEMHRLEIGRGGEYKVELPDGSRVWLNSESRITYPTRFTGDERRVWLHGEAYFEVTPDASRPFIVSVDACEARVLGTSFNVTRYDGDTHVITTVLDGCVEVTAGGVTERLLPDRQCLYNPLTGTMTTRVVDASRVVSWKNGLFIFDDVSIEQIARQIARWYDVSVRFADDASRAASFTGAMERYRPVSYIARLLGETNTVGCYLEDNRVLVFHALK